MKSILFIVRSSGNKSTLSLNHTVMYLLELSYFTLQAYRNGFLNMNLSFIIMKIFYPIMISLLLTLTVPYVATAGIMPLIGMSLLNITYMFYDSLEPKYRLSSIDFLGRCFLQVLMETYYKQSILFISNDTNPASIFLF